MGGKSGSAPAPPQVYGYQADYAAYVGAGGPATFDQYQEYHGTAPAAPFQMPSFSSGGSSGSSQADYAAQLAAQQAAQERTIGENDRDALFSDYMSAADSATDYINNQIKQQQSNSSLLGTKYEVNDAQKGQMISDYFATIWGAGDQDRLQGLMDKWGNPQGFTDFAVIRGDGSAYEGTAGSEETVSTSKPRATLAGGEEEEDTLSKLSLLGG